MDDNSNIGLLELQEMVAAAIDGSFSARLWLRAEVSEMKVNPSGHCYLTLVEKDPSGYRLLARASAVIWASPWRLVRACFESETGRPLSAGMSILARVQVQYTALYGLSLIIGDIDPSYSVGALEAARQKTIRRLEEEGMFDMNPSLVLPRLPRRFAVVTSSTAAGYRDFERQLHENEYGFRFRTELFQAVMQGDAAPASIIAALDRVAAEQERFDAVLILRGGGGAMDMVCFDDYELAVNVAQFPLPVLTGIGHDHDLHIVDMVAHTSVKTPTALADHIVGIFCDEEYAVDSLSARIRTALSGKSGREHAVIDRLLAAVRSAAALRYASETLRIERLCHRIAAASPADVLEKGFVLAVRDGKRVSSASEVKAGDRLTLLFKDGRTEVIVI